MNTFNRNLFPLTPADFIQAKRVAVLYQPILGSPEQLVIGMITYNDGGVFLEQANMLNRLDCFYGTQAAGPVMAIKLALDELRADLKNGPDILADYSPAVSGLKLAEPHDAEGRSLREIASFWLAGMSSLYNMPSGNGVSMDFPPMHATASNDIVSRESERLSSLLFEYVTEKQPILASAFSHDIRHQTKRRRGKASSIFIDFNGSKLVANFGLLTPNAYSSSVDKIKRSMWDLKVSRDNENPGLLSAREHEMIVQHPPQNDPQLSQKQVDKIMDGLEELEKQADQEEIRFRPMTTVADIGNHLVKKEAA